MKVITPGVLPEERTTRTRSVLSRYPGIEENEQYLCLSRHYGEPVLPKGYAIDPVTEVEVKAALQGQEIPEGLFWFVITTDQVDRANDRIIATGCRLRNFASNPVVLWAHNHDIPAIGRSEAFRAPFTLPDGRTAILMGLRFQTATQYGREVGALVQQGFLRTGSIGLIPLAWEEEPVAKYPNAYPFTDTVRSYTEWELLEFSICNVPMNPGATAYDDLNAIVSRAVAQGVLTSDAAFIRTMQLEPTHTLPASADKGKAQSDAPNYREADGKNACATCRFYEDGACSAHEFEADPAYVCDDYAAEEVETETDKSFCEDLTLLIPDDMNIQALAEKAGLTPEQFTAAMNAVKKEAEEKSFAAQMAKRDAMDQIWDAVWTLQSVVCEAVEEHMDGEGTAKTDGLLQDFIDAANMVIALIRSLPTEEREMVMRSVAQRRDITKAGSVLNAANKEHAKTIYKAAGVCNKSIGEIFEAAKALLDNAGVTEEGMDEEKEKVFNDDAPLIPTDKAATLEELAELVQDLATELARTRADIAEVKSYTKPELPPIEETPDETPEPPADDDAPVVSIFGS